MVNGHRSIPKRFVLQYAQNRQYQSVSLYLGECARAQEGLIGPWMFHPSRNSWLPGLAISAIERIRTQLGGLSHLEPLRASPVSSFLFADESPLMRRVDDSRSLPRCLDTAPTRGRPPPCPADDSAAGRPAAGIFKLRSGRNTRNARGQAAPGAPRILLRGPGRLTQYCSV
jgi:hypothetical protein